MDRKQVAALLIKNDIDQVITWIEKEKLQDDKCVVLVARYRRWNTAYRMSEINMEQWSDFLDSFYFDVLSCL